MKLPCVGKINVNVILSLMTFISSAIVIYNQLIDDLLALQWKLSCF